MQNKIVKMASSYQERTQERNNYYINDGRKVGDFCLGFFGIWIIMIAITTLFSLITSLFGGFSSILNLFGIFSISGVILGVILVILGITLSFKKGRRYIGIGIIVSALIPLLIFGACLIIISGM